ncbi:hypothetical protein MTR67_010220, partial [Solanum verrucosum]
RQVFRSLVYVFFLLFILSFLLLSTTLCLFPLVAFSRSSTTFTSNYPTVLPTTTHNNDDDVPPPALDMHMILSVLPGGGSIYLADLGNTKCPNGVMHNSSGEFDHSTPMTFFTMQLGGHENQDVSIMLSTPTSKLCAKEIVWKVGDYFITLHPPPRFVVTGGT